MGQGVILGLEIHSFMVYYDSVFNFYEGKIMTQKEKIKEMSNCRALELACRAELCKQEQSDPREVMSYARKNGFRWSYWREKGWLYDSMVFWKRSSDYCVVVTDCFQEVGNVYCYTKNEAIDRQGVPAYLFE